MQTRQARQAKQSKQAPMGSDIEFYRAKRNQSEVTSVEEDMEESLISNREQSNTPTVGRRILASECFKRAR